MPLNSAEEQMLPTVKKLPTYGAKSLTKGMDQAQIILGGPPPSIVGPRASGHGPLVLAL